MKAQELVNKGIVSTEELIDFCEGTGNFEQTQRDLNEATGFDKANLDLCTLENLTKEDILDAEIIE